MDDRGNEKGRRNGRAAYWPCSRRDPAAIKMAHPAEWFTEPGDHPVDVPIICAMTRFGLRSARHLVPTYLDYRQVVRGAQTSETPGLLRSVFLVENPTTCFSVSLWSHLDAISYFGTNVPFHVDAARRIFGRLAFDESRGVELWSTKWRLVSVSNNLKWDDFDLRSMLLHRQRSDDVRS